MKRVLAILLSCLMIIASFGACSNKPAESKNDSETEQSTTQDGTSENSDWTTKKVTLTFLHGHTDEGVAKVITSKGFRTMVDKFIAEHPNVTIEEQKNSDLGPLLLQQAAANNLPDVIQTTYGQMPATAGTGQLADITDLVDPNMYIGKLFSETWDGKIYGLAMKGTEYNLLWYNSNMLKEAGLDEFPTKMDDLLALDKYFDAKGIDLIALGNNVAWYTPACLFGPIFYEKLGLEKGQSLVLSDGTVKWTDPAVIEAMSWLPKIAATCNEDFNQQDDIWAAGWYAQGKAFCYPGGSWVASTIKTFENDYPDVVAATRCALVPSISGEKANTYIMAAEAEGYSINSRLKRGTPEFDAAFALISQICSKDYAEMMAENGTISAPISDKKVDTSSFPQMTQDFIAIHNAGYTSALTLQSYIDVSVFNALTPELQTIMGGTNTPEQAAANVQAALDAKLSQK